MANVDEETQIQLRIARIVADSLAGSDWTRTELFFSSIGTVRTWFQDAYDREDRDIRVRSDRSVGNLLEQLKELMADPEKGTWVSASLTMAADGQYRFSFNYDRQGVLEQRSRAVPGAAGR